MRAATSPCFFTAQGHAAQLEGGAESLHCQWNNPEASDHPKRKKRRRKDGSYSAVACMLPVPTVLLAVTNIQMTSLHGNLLTWSLLIGIQSYVQQRGEYCSE